MIEKYSGSHAWRRGSRNCDRKFFSPDKTLASSRFVIFTWPDFWALRVRFKGYGGLRPSGGLA